jgi:hypothetical protein
VQCSQRWPRPPAATLPLTWLLLIQEGHPCQQILLPPPQWLPAARQGLYHPDAYVRDTNRYGVMP